MTDKSIEDFRALSDERWLDMLISSSRDPVVGGLKFPGFPSAETQAQFVGSAYENALREAFVFYTTVKAYAKSLGNPVREGMVALDFGCGWGRFLRFLWKDINTRNIYGVDVDPDILADCTRLGVPGQLSQIASFGSLPQPDKSVDLILAYSVFTHLPENVFVHWMNEIKRVAKPGCVFAFTIEPRRFLEFIGSLGSRPPESAWHAGLQRYSEKMPELLSRYDQGEFIYIPTGGGAYRDADVYGDAVVPITYLKQQVAPEFNVWGHIDDPKRFWQAVVVMQKV